jgi:hypothetical protein
VRANDANNEEMSDKRYDSRFVRVTCGSATAFGACMVFVFGYQILSFGRIWNCVGYCTLHHGWKEEGLYVCLYIQARRKQRMNDDQLPLSWPFELGITWKQVTQPLALKTLTLSHHPWSFTQINIKIPQWTQIHLFHPKSSSPYEVHKNKTKEQS